MVYIFPGGNCTGMAIFFLTKCHIWNTLMDIIDLFWYHFSPSKTPPADLVNFFVSLGHPANHPYFQTPQKVNHSQCHCICLCQPWEYRIEYRSKVEILNLFTVSNSIKYQILNIKYRRYFLKKENCEFSLVPSKKSFLRTKTHIFGS